MILNSHRTPGTAAACEELAAVGATHFELDVRLLDGQLHVSHFVPLLPGAPWVEHDGWSVRARPRRVTAELVGAALQRIPPQCRVVLDLKDDRPAAADRLVRRLLQEQLGPSRTVISSKDARSLRTAAQAGYDTWLSIANRVTLARLLAGRSAAPGRTVAVRHTYLERSVVDALHARGLGVIAWTVDELATAVALSQRGVDGLTSDRPEVFAGVSSSPPA